MSTITAEQEQAIATFLANRHIPKGLGTKEEACSIAAINLALSGELTDKIPACMSEVIGRWIISVQDSIPDVMRNSERWRKLLPLAAGTGREREKEGLALIMDWMWSTVLPTLQPFADAHGFGSEWLAMCETRTVDAAEASEAAAAAAWAAAWAAAAWRAAKAAAAWAAWETETAGAAALAAAIAAAEAAAWETETAAANNWEKFDPCGLLERLIELPKGEV